MDEPAGSARFSRRTPFVLRSYRPGDETAIVDLFARCFHQHRSLEHWRWEYLDNPLGGPFVSLACAPGGEPVAHYAGYPVRFRARGDDSPRQLPAFQIGDTMTLPAVRHVGRGPTSLLARTALHFYEHHAAGNVAFDYGFNVGNIQKFSIRFLRAERVAPVAYRRLSGEPLARLRKQPTPRRWLAGLLPGYRAQRCTTIDERWDELFDRVADDYELLAERRAQNLGWRYLARPGFDYRLHAAFRGDRLVAWGVFLRRDDVLRWGDALVDPRHPRALGAVLRSALGAPENDGVVAVEGWFPPRPAVLDEALAAIGFERRPEPQGLDLMCVPFTRPSAAEELRVAYYTLGDSDLF